VNPQVSEGRIKVGVHEPQTWFEMVQSAAFWAKVAGVMLSRSKMAFSKGIGKRGEGEKEVTGEGVRLARVKKEEED